MVALAAFSIFRLSAGFLESLRERVAKLSELLNGQIKPLTSFTIKSNAAPTGVERHGTPDAVASRRGTGPP